MNRHSFGLIQGGKSGIELMTDKNNEIRDLFTKNPLAVDSSDDSDLPSQERRNRDLLSMELLKELKPNQAVKFKRVKHTIDFLVKEKIVKANSDTQVIEMLNSDLNLSNIRKRSISEKCKNFCTCRCQKKKQIIEDLAIDDDGTDEEDQLDHLELKLDQFLAREMNARRNWERLKMRIMVIQKFSSLSNFKKKLEVQ